MKKLETSITITRLRGGGEDEKHVCIRIKDEASRIDFIEVSIPLEGFADALMGLSEVECAAEVRGFEYVGKVKEREKASVFISDEEYASITKGIGYHSAKKVLGQWLVENKAREGWIVDTYLGAQGSIEYADNGKQLNFAYYRYVEKSGE